MPKKKSLLSARKKTYAADSCSGDNSIHKCEAIICDDSAQMVMAQTRAVQMAVAWVNVVQVILEIARRMI